jgi:hypothetical protein
MAGDYHCLEQLWYARYYRYSLEILGSEQWSQGIFISIGLFADSILQFQLQPYASDWHRFNATPRLYTPFPAHSVRTKQSHCAPSLPWTGSLPRVQILASSQYKILHQHAGIDIRSTWVDLNFLAGTR